MERRQVILVTDGDQAAKTSLEVAARRVGGRCISLSAGNPSHLSGPELVELIKQAANDPVLVMFDDCGLAREGVGEQALKYVATHPDIEVLGAIAVASNCKNSKGTPVHVTVNRWGQLTANSVDKFGRPQYRHPLRIFGDTVEVLNEVAVPFVVGIGDIGKMGRKDGVELGAPVTTKAVQLILDHYRRAPKTPSRP
ncbi:MULTISPECIES: stage V sporulation protein AE [Thermoactinomyces]|jgi:stage V sporulation protein AE|uniref:Stage V sporulation protein AE n=1 Tax=Thermoactinomyces daqus TaxID=1329516 RepID=A0A7W1XAG3_9BACL|nr:MULTISPECIES: stage V sporulation protein AE [Thermoactinomyces]MBA4543085.1 stage V sporulation protein AE [Thermoactinomyces daqus]MBH8596680.1 stage V sporulation protein AE [Thermoactinomyces sp. CICC 10523]MBH8603442.1 stage V sporulation protein AE [Thermoactinomyces sp. CICC 10522]MBH8606607.1 stage V sporulation protein AE [Thermoactinomyces sp. CICC 10521]